MSTTEAQNDASVDIRYQVKRDGEWCDALCRQSDDANNKAFWVINPNGSLSDSGVTKRGEDENEFRNAQ